MFDTLQEKFLEAAQELMCQKAKKAVETCQKEYEEIKQSLDNIFYDYIKYKAHGALDNILFSIDDINIYPIEFADQLAPCWKRADELTELFNKEYLLHDIELLKINVRSEKKVPILSNDNFSRAVSFINNANQLLHLQHFWTEVDFDVLYLDGYKLEARRITRVYDAWKKRDPDSSRPGPILHTMESLIFDKNFILLWNRDLKSRK